MLSQLLFKKNLSSIEVVIERIEPAISPEIEPDYGKETFYGKEK